MRNKNEYEIQPLLTDFVDVSATFVAFFRTISVYRQMSLRRTNFS